MYQTTAHNFYNKGAEDLAELKSGDTVRLIPPRILTNEAVKAKVNKPVGIRSYEVNAEDGARYRRNRHHFSQWQCPVGPETVITAIFKPKPNMPGSLEMPESQK